MLSTSSTTPRGVIMPAHVKQMMDAIESRDAAKVRELLAAGFSANTTMAFGRTALHLAALHGDEAIAGILLAARASVHAICDYQFTPLCYAARLGRHNVMKLLLAAGSVTVWSQYGPPGYETISRRNMPLLLATRYQHIEAMRALLETGLCLDDMLEQPAYIPSVLHEACCAQGKIEAVDLLLAAGAKIEATDGEGRTALHVAARYGNLPALQRLLACGANPNAETAIHSTPLHHAAFSAVEGGAALECIRVLIGTGVCIDARSTQLRTPLHFAAQSAEPFAVRELIEQGADINAQDYVGNTPLHVAMERRAVGVVELLLVEGANADLVNKAGLSPRTMAAAHAEMLALIARHAQLNKLV